MEGSEMEGKEGGGEGCRLSDAGCISHLKGIKLKQINKQSGWKFN